jgi:hypothetical protein
VLAPTGVYTVLEAGTAYTASRTVLQINAAATKALVLLRAWVSQLESETATAEEIQLLRTTTAGTGTSVTPAPLSGAQAATSTASRNHTAEGTAGTELFREGWEVRNGWLYHPVPEERIIVPPSGRLALRLPSAPEASLTIIAGMTFAELG